MLNYTGCAHPVVGLDIDAGENVLSGMYLRNNGEPTAVHHDAVAVTPDTQLVTQHSCVVSDNDNEVTNGTWHAKVFLLDGSDFAYSTFNASMTLSQQAGFESSSAEGYLCCGETLYFRVNLAANKQLVVSLNLTMAKQTDSGTVEALFVQQDSCPTPNTQTCDVDDHCFYDADESDGYSIEVPLELVAQVQTEWCIAVKALDSSSSEDAATFILSNEAKVTPAPTATPEISYNPCTEQDLYCRRSFVEESSAPDLFSVSTWLLIGLLTIGAIVVV
jgi:hypothetical protein